MPHPSGSLLFEHAGRRKLQGQTQSKKRRGVSSGEDLKIGYLRPLRRVGVWLVVILGELAEGVISWRGEKKSKDPMTGNWEYTIFRPSTAEGHMRNGREQGAVTVSEKNR